MATLALTLSGSLTGMADGSSKTWNVAYANASAPGYPDNVSLTTSISTLTIPSNTRFVVVVPPSGNTTNILVGDTGTLVTLDGTTTTLLPIPASSPVVKLSAASGTISNVTIWYM